MDLRQTSRLWCDLLEDLLELVFKQPGMNSFDLLSCHDVCVSWRAVVKKLIISSSRNQSSRMILTSKLFFPNKRYKTTEFYQINLPITYNGRKPLSSSRGWILSVAKSYEFYEYDLQLFNPLSQANIQLLPFSYLPPRNFILSPSPFDLNSKILVIYNGFLEERRFTGQDGTHSLTYVNPTRFDDIVFYKGEFVGIYDCGELRSVKVPFRRVETENPRTRRRYLVESPSGDLLMVVRLMKWKTVSPDNNNDYKTTEFEVYLRNFGIRTWEKVTSLGDHVLCLQQYDSRCVPVHDPELFEPNAIYFLDDSMKGYCPSRGTDFGIFDMESKTIQQFDSLPFNRWFKPEH